MEEREKFALAVGVETHIVIDRDDLALLTIPVSMAGKRRMKKTFLQIHLNKKLRKDGLKRKSNELFKKHKGINEVQVKLNCFNSYFSTLLSSKLTPSEPRRVV